MRLTILTIATFVLVTRAVLAAGCGGIPQPASEDLVLAVTAYQGTTYSSAYVGGPDGDATYFVPVTVSKGDTPIYFVALSNESIIWSFSGDTERLAQVVLVSPHPSAVAGIPERQVVFARANSCLKSNHQDHDPNFDSDMQRLVGRPFSKATAYALTSVSLPHLQIVSVPGDQAGYYTQPVVAPVDPATLISKADVGTYDVLPGFAGLEQLLKAGALVQVDSRTYRVIKPIPRYPADLYGANARFILAEGVPPPPGDPGFSCVITEKGVVIASSGPCRL